MSTSDDPYHFEADQLAQIRPASIECRISQRGAKWHWQIINNLEQVLASGVAESELAARMVGVLLCLQRLDIQYGPSN